MRDIDLLALEQETLLAHADEILARDELASVYVPNAEVIVVYVGGGRLSLGALLTLWRSESRGWTWDASLVRDEHGKPLDGDPPPRVVRAVRLAGSPLSGSHYIRLIDDQGGYHTLCRVPRWPDGGIYADQTRQALSLASRSADLSPLSLSQVVHDLGRPQPDLAFVDRDGGRVATWSHRSRTLFDREGRPIAGLVDTSREARRRLAEERLGADSELPSTELEAPAADLSTEVPSAARASASPRRADRGGRAKGLRCPDVLTGLPAWQDDGIRFEVDGHGTFVAKEEGIVDLANRVVVTWDRFPPLAVLPALVAHLERDGAADP